MRARPNLAATGKARSVLQFAFERQWPSVVLTRRAKAIALLMPALGLLSGCIMPWPHTSIRSAAIHGTVLEAHTHAPIEGAKVALWDGFNKTVSFTTDAKGHFRHAATHNFHLAYVGVEGADWPRRHYCFDGTVSHPGYVTQHFSYAAVPGDCEVNFLLKPEP